MQNCKMGGLDTFVIELLSHWPGKDELALFCNESHPGLENLRQRLPDSVTIVPYEFLISYDFDLRFQTWPTLVSYLAKIVFWGISFYYQISILKKILKNR